MKLVELCFDSQFVGHVEKIVSVPDDADEDYVRSLFLEHIGVEFDYNTCWYREVVEEGFQ